MGVIRFIVYSNLLVSLSAGSICYAFCLEHEIGKSNYYGLFVFFSTLLTYNAQRIVKRKQDKVDWTEGRLLWIKKHNPLLLIICFLSFVGCLYIFFSELYNLHSLLFLAPLAIISIFYAFKIGKRKTLRELPHIKIHLIAFVWVCSTCIFPAWNEEILNFNIALFCLGFYLYILAITVPFDIRDIDFDAPQNNTVPQLFGVDLAKKIALITLIAAYFIFHYFMENSIQHFCLVLAFLVQGMLIYNTHKKRPELYFSGAIDGAILILAISFLGRLM